MCGWRLLYHLPSLLARRRGDTEKEIFQRIAVGHIDFETAPWPSISNEAKGGWMLGWGHEWGWSKGGP